MKNHLFLPILLLLLAGATRPGLPVMAQESRATLRPDPLNLELRPGSQGTLKVVVENVHGLYGLEFHLLFDPQVVEVVDADPDQAGIQIEPSAIWKNGFVAVNRVDARSGRIDFAATLLRPAAPISGDRTMAVIRFVGAKVGVSALRIESGILSTGEAERITFAWQAGSIGVNPQGEMAGSASGRVDVSHSLLAGLAVLAFLVALGVFLIALQRERR